MQPPIPTCHPDRVPTATIEAEGGHVRGISEIALDRFGISAFYPIVCDKGLEAIHRVHPAAEEVETRQFVLETEQKVAARCNTRGPDVGCGTAVSGGAAKLTLDPNRVMNVAVMILVMVITSAGRT